jgi:hypothetical protein
MKGKFIAGAALGIVALAGFGAGSLAFAAGERAKLSLDAKPMTVSPEFQKKLDTKYGSEELVRLQHDLDASLKYARKKTDPVACAGGAVTLETTLVDADPNHPTMEQLRQQPGLDWMRSISLGGAKLKGELKSADGKVVATAEGEYRSIDLRDARMSGGDTWGDAHRGIDNYTRDVAKACRGAK